MSEENENNGEDYSYLDEMFATHEQGRFGKVKKDEESSDTELNEGSTENAEGTLSAIIGTLEKNNNRDKKQNDMLSMGKGIMSHYKKEKSFSPDQAKWIFNMSKMFK